MRLWHKKLLAYLPDNFLSQQLKDCSKLSTQIAKYNTTKDRIVSKVMCYGKEDFNSYCNLVIAEMMQRELPISKATIGKIHTNTGFVLDLDEVNSNIYADWHNHRYLVQCYYALQEYRDCGLINDKDWNRIENNIRSIK